MTMRAALMRVLLQEDLNFLLTNRLPRRLATRAMGRVSKIRHPLVRGPSIAAWRFFSGADLSDAAETRFDSLHHAFTRALRPGARAFDPRAEVVASPCDAIVGAHGAIEGDRLYQVKGFPYRLSDLVPDPQAVARVAGGHFVTLRLTAGMYHRFHAPDDLVVDRVTYLSGDCWNVNPVALKRVERLFCRNERAVIEARLGADRVPVLMVPVAAILVAAIRLTFLDLPGLLREGGPRRIECGIALPRGAEMGWFEHGSTIVMLVPPTLQLAPGLAEGAPIRAGAPLFVRATRPARA